MKLFLYFLLLIATNHATGQNRKSDAFSISKEVDKQIEALKKDGVHTFLIYQYGCTGCEVKSSSETCNCVTENLFFVSIFYQAGNKNYLREVHCCKISEPKEIDKDFFDNLNTLQDELQKTTRESRQKFFPPVIVHQSYYSLRYFAPDLKFDFTLFEGQVNDNTENNLWKTIDIFNKRKDIFDYVISIQTGE